MAELGYLVADAVGMTLSKTAAGVEGSGSKTFALNHWKLRHTVEVQSDIVSKKEYAVYVRLSARVWGYLTISSLDTFFYIFDAKKVGITLENCKEFGSGAEVRGCVSSAETLKRLREAVAGVYTYHHTEGWVNAVGMAPSPL